MWCPKCKTEYREGITVCADCGTELIETPVTEVDICEINDEKIAGELLEFLKYSGIKEARIEENQDGVGYRIIVPQDAEVSADKIVHGYLLAKEEIKEEEVDSAADTESIQKEQEETVYKKEIAKAENSETEAVVDEKEETTEADEDAASDKEEDLLIADEIEEDTVDLLYTSGKKEYVKKADLYRDTKFSGITFLIFGIIGEIYLLLSKLEVIPIEYNTVIFYIIVVLFAAFIVAGIVSLVNSKKIRLQIPEEEFLTNSIKEWLDETITDKMVDGWLDDSVSEMENDLVVTAHIRSKLLKEYPDLQKEYIEMIADEYFEEHFFEEE